jgi:purine catabolism regulator
VSITVRELLDMPHLQLRLHSGKAGLDRQVTWTHTSDLPEPWQWVSGGELLMTNGMSFPADADGQEHLVDELHRIGASGLAIGEQMYCPKLTQRFTQASERLGLPVLWIRYPMPFVAISRAIAEATLLEQSQRLMRTARIYDALRHTTGGDVARSSSATA